MWLRGGAGARKPVEGRELLQIRSSRASRAPGLRRGRCLEDFPACQQAASEKVSKWAFPGLFSSLLLPPLTGTLAKLKEPAVWMGQKLILHSHPLHL